MINSSLKILLSFLLLTFIVSSYAQEKPKTVANGKNNLSVLVKYKSQPEKQEDALSALNALILEVKKEHNFVNIKMLVDPADKTNILLYEEWSDEAYYKGCLLYTSDAADERSSVDIGGRRIIKKKTKKSYSGHDTVNHSA